MPHTGLDLGDVVIRVFFAVISDQVITFPHTDSQLNHPLKVLGHLDRVVTAPVGYFVISDQVIIFRSLTNSTFSLRIYIYIWHTSIFFSVFTHIFSEIISVFAQ